MSKRGKFLFGILGATLFLCTGCSDPIAWIQRASATVALNTTTQPVTTPADTSNHIQTNRDSSTNVPVKKTIKPNTANATSGNIVNGHTSAPSKPVLPPSVLIDVAPLDQYPELPNGCEVTSLAMLLAYLGHPVNKEDLAHDEPSDPTKRVSKPDGTTTYWGNPNVGFVGSPFQKYNGYGIYHGPMTKFLNQILPGQAVDLTGQPFSNIIQSVANGIPVVVWDTATFKPTNSWTSWNTPEGPIKITLQEHVVLVVGYNAKQLFVNNPLNGKKAQPVNRAEFIAAWKQLGEQAITVKQT